MSLIVEGEIDVSYVLGSRESRVVDTLIAGDILGWSALVEPCRMTGIATTRKATRLIRIRPGRSASFANAIRSWAIG